MVITGDTDPNLTAGTTSKCSAGQNTTTVLVVPPVGVAKNSPTITHVSGNQWTAAYLVTVTNTGTSDGKYTLTDTPAFASGVTLNSWTVTTVGGTVNASLPASPSGQISATDVTIAKGATHTYTVTITFTTSAAATALTCNQATGNGAFNTASVTGTTTASATACGPLPPPLQLTLGKTSTLQKAAKGSVFNYTITASNVGSQVATGNPTTLVDTIPAGIKVTTITDAVGFTCTPSAVLPLVGDGSTTTISCTSTTGIAADAQNIQVTTLGVEKTGTSDVTNTVVATAGDPRCTGTPNPCSASVVVTDNTPAPPPEPGSVAPIPTTSPEGLAALALMMVGVAGWAVRRQRRGRK